MHSARTDHPPRRCRAFTLVELAVSLAIMSIILVGAGAAVTMSVSAADRSDDVNTRLTAAADVLDRMSADIQSAVAVVERTSRAVTVLVPDRNGDQQPEQIRYAWTGSVGGVLIRSVNNADAVVILSPVDAMAMSPLLRAGQITTDSDEQVLAGYESSSGATLRRVSINATNRAAQYVKPAFASNVSSWRITRVRVSFQRVSSVGTLRVRIVEAENWQPMGATLAAVDLARADLPGSQSFFDVAIPTGAIDPKRGVFIVLESNDLNATQIQFGEGGNPMPFNTYLALSGDSGASWSGPQDVRDLCFQAYGIVTTRE
ncbi:MAG: type II secretion system protein J [Phycisphaerales bacterium]